MMLRWLMGKVAVGRFFVIVVGLCLVVLLFCLVGCMHLRLSYLLLFMEWSWQPFIICIVVAWVKLKLCGSSFHNNNVLVPWVMRIRWLSCIRFLWSIRFQVTHIYCEGNKVLIYFLKDSFRLQLHLGMLHFPITAFLFMVMIFFFFGGVIDLLDLCLILYLYFCYLDL